VVDAHTDESATVGQHRLFDRHSRQSGGSHFLFLFYSSSSSLFIIITFPYSESSSAVSILRPNFKNFKKKEKNKKEETLQLFCFCIRLSSYSFQQHTRDYFIITFTIK